MAQFRFNRLDSDPVGSTLYGKYYWYFREWPPDDLHARQHADLWRRTNRAMDLNSYNVGLTLTSDKGTAGTDFYFEGSPTTDRPPDSANTYVFAADLSVSPFGFVATADKELGTNTALLSLSDFLDSGQFITDASPNTMLATVVIGTTSRTGDLTLRFDSSVLELLTPDWQPVPGSSTLAANLDSFDPPVVTQVPEPSSIALLCPLLGLCGIAIGWRKRMRNHVVQSSNFGEHRVSKPRRRRTSVPFRCRRFPSYLSKSIVKSTATPRIGIAVLTRSS